MKSRLLPKRSAIGAFSAFPRARQRGSRRDDPTGEWPTCPPPRTSRRATPAATSSGEASIGPRLVVGIGASAGGLQAFKAFFAHMPADSGMSFVVVQHLAPQHPSILPELIAPATAMPVVSASDQLPMEPDHIYVIPPDATLSIERGRLLVARPAPARESRRPVDTLFHSLALDQEERAVCIILSGGGSDGTEGVVAVKEHGGLTMAQAAFDAHAMTGMPSSAAATGLVDYVLAVEDMPARLLAHAAHLQLVEAHKGPDGTRDDAAAHLAQICTLLRSSTGHDFSQYKSKTLVRRIQRRMQVLQIEKTADYVTHLRKELREAEILFHELLIGVTHFFRDPSAFTALETLVVPQILENAGSVDAVRVWVPACATGQEVYSIAILLKEASRRFGREPKVQIFATDIDEPAITVARAGRYARAQFQEMSAERLERWFVPEGEFFRANKSIREMCIFSTHNVVRDPPFSRLDLISCRNLMIYLDGPLQDRLLRTFHYALRPGGYLMLGTSENVGRQGKLFSPLDQKNRVFQRRDVHAALPSFPTSATRGSLPTPERTPLENTIEKAAHRLMEKHVPPYVVIDGNQDVLRFSGSIDRYLGPAPGAASLNLSSLLRRGLRSAARSALTEARAKGHAVSREALSIEENGVRRLVDLTVELLPGNEAGLCVVAFVDRKTDPVGEATTTSLPLEALEQELRTTRRRLESTVEQLETANEDMKSANEEYQSINEELQSTNEELETSKEEMQSINEELQTVNAELNSKNTVLTSLNSDLKNLLDSTQIAALFLDRQLRIRAFTPAVTQILHVREGDQGRPVTEIASRLVGDHLHTDAAQVMQTLGLIEREVHVRDTNRWFAMTLRPYRTVDDVIDGVVVTLFDITDRKRADDLQAHMMDELNHRVKNTLATVQSIAASSFRGIEESARRAFDARLVALSRTHNLLARENWHGASLRELVEQELEPYRASHATRFVIHGPDVDLNPAAALVLGLAIHELTTNAAKYGALSNPTGRVDVEWQIQQTLEAKALAFHWRETGGPLVEKPERHGFGSTVIERGLSHELDGKVTTEFHPIGVVFTAALPLDVVAGRTTGEPNDEG